MQSNITIKFLSPKDMENAKDLDWRYEHVTSDNLGFSDKKKNRVFIKSGLDADVTKYLIDHEISHLFEMKGTDEDDHGIRHKKSKPDRTKDAERQTQLYGPGHYETDKHQNTYWVPDNGAINEQLSARRGSQNSGEGSWWQESWSQLKPLVTYALSSLAGSALGNLFGGGAGAAGSAAGTMGGNVLPSGAGISMNAGGIGSGIGGEVAGGLLKSAAAPAIGQQTSSFMQGNPSDFTNALGRLFTGGSKGGSSYSPPTNDFQIPNQSQDQSSMFSGSYGAGIPETPNYFGATGFENIEGLGGKAGLSKMPLNPGLGQAGIGLSGQEMGEEGFGQTGMNGGAMNQMFQGPQYDPTGFNYSNQGLFSF